MTLTILCYLIKTVYSLTNSLKKHDMKARDLSSSVRKQCVYH